MRGWKYTYIDPFDVYEIYAHRGAKARVDPETGKGIEPDLIRLTSIGHGPERETVGRLVDDGNGYYIELGGEGIHLNYCQMEYLRILLEIQDEINDVPRYQRSSYQVTVEPFEWKPPVAVAVGDED